MKCWHCKAESSAAHYDRIVNNKTLLHGEWDGWRMSGRFLIAPGKAGKILPARVLGWLWQERARRSTEKLRTMPTTESRLFQLQGDCKRSLPAREIFRGQA